MIKRLAIITTHPIQYNAPLFTCLTLRGKIKLKVFYTWGPGVLENKFDPGFGKKIQWDIPLLQGYEYSFVHNVSADPGSHHFKGIDNPALIKEIINWGADGILIYGWNFKSHLKAMRYFHGRITVLFRGDSTSLKESGFIKRWFRRIFLKWVYRHVDYALYVGTHNSNYFKENGLNNKKLVFAPHAIDIDRFRKEFENNTDQVTGWKKALGIAEGHMTILYAGKLDENKNVKLLGEAFCSLDQKDIHLIIAGNGVIENELKKRFSENRNVHFLPFQNQSQMPLLYGMADVFVLPSLSETWGLGINEAMACGNAILASSTCGAAIDLVKEGLNGFTFKSNDIDDLRNKLGNLVADRKRVREMGKRSQEIIEDWNFDKTASAIEEVLFRP